MTQFETWKLLTDCGLLGSLIYFALRYLRNQSAANPHQLQELHNGLRNAIREADQAGKSLNQQLITRKQSLEKLIFDVQSAESRLNRSIDSAEERKAELDFRLNNPSYNQTATTGISAQPETAAYQPPKRDLLKVEIELDKAVAGDDEFVQAVTAAPKTNIFGETISGSSVVKDSSSIASDENIEHAFGQSPLTTKIEKEINVAAGSYKKKETSPEEVYSMAEELLRAGKAIDEVSRQTNLTADEVRILSQMLESETEQESSQEIRTEDNRLGVLSGFKRQVQVL